MTNFNTGSALSDAEMREFRHGRLGVSDFDSDFDIQIEIDVNDYNDYNGCVYLDRAKVIELRDWLTEQIERTYRCGECGNLHMRTPN